MSLAPGTLLGPYEILNLIGSGGMGEVYKARDPRLDRVVAVKVCGQRFSDRFENEVRTIASLNHPHICSVFDVGPDYLVMEYIDGEPLRPLDEWRRLLDIAVQIADGMAAAHAAGLVHRDLKPDNILVTREGRVKILDFGLARAAAGAAAAGDAVTRTLSVTNPGSVVGTVRYMSPEQARGLDLDARSDQFSFGLILYEMTGARPPFQRETAAETMAAIIRQDPEPLPPGVPAPLRWTIARCLAKDPAERYGTTRDLYLELRTLRDRLSESHTATAPAPVRRRFPWATAVLAVLLLATGVFAYLQRAPAAPAMPQYTPFATSGNKERSPAWSADGRTLAFVRDVDGVGQVHTRALDSPQVATITSGAGDAISPFWSADGSRVGFGRGGSLYVTSASGGEPQLLVQNAVEGSFSPDGRRLAFFRPSTGAVWLARPDGSEAAPYHGKNFPPRLRAAIPRFSSTGADLGVLALPDSSSGSTLELWTIPSQGGDPVKVAGGLPMYLNAKFSWGDGDRGFLLARMSGENSPVSEARHLYWLDRRTARLRRLTTGPQDECEPAVSPDGTRVAVTMMSVNSDVWEFDAPTGEGRPVAAGSRQESSAEWTPSGREFAYIGEVDGRVQVWFRAETGPPRALTLSGPPLGEIRWITISPDGNRVALDTYGAPHRAMVVAAAGGVPVALDPANRDSHGASFSPDEKWIAFTRLVETPAGAQGYVSRISSAGTGQPVDLVATGGTPGFAVHWSPAGDWIAYLKSGPQGGELRLVSPDGQKQRTLLAPAYAAWCFNADGSQIYGVRRGEDRKWTLWSLNVASGAERKISQLALAPQIQVTHLSLHRDGRRLLVSVNTESSDIWMIGGLPR